jgi:glycosyltransferase involved in cell wall biosynthesis
VHLHKSCVIIVENLPVPLDRRVWQMARALNGAGWRVSVICPMNERFPRSFEEIEGIAIYRHKLPVEARGKLAFLLEYGFALFHEMRLLIKVYRERGFSIIQACNPPDIIFLTALPFKLLGKRFIFDHHDVSPELYIAKFKRKDLFYRLLLAFEWLTFKSSNLVISSNETFRELAMTRGGKAADKVVTVYSFPDKINIFRTEPNQALRKGRKFVIGYVGVMSDQDGVDNLIHACAHLVHEIGYDDFQVSIVGDGPALSSLKELAVKVNVEERVTFAGYLTGKDLVTHLSAFDIGVIPDPLNECNDKMSMNKVFEYSALGIPIVAYPLKETQRLLGTAAAYAKTPDPAGLALECHALMRDDALRRKSGEIAKAVSKNSFDWDRESAKYVNAYQKLASSSEKDAQAAQSAEGLNLR